jgi:hypothetical protein
MVCTPVIPHSGVETSPKVCETYCSTENQGRYGGAHFFFFFFGFSEIGFLCVALAVLELRNPPASASQVLGLKVCATTPGLAVHTFKAGRSQSLKASLVYHSQSLSQKQDRQTATKAKDPDLSFIPFVRQGLTVIQAVLEPTVLFSGSASAS